MPPIEPGLGRIPGSSRFRDKDRYGSRISCQSPPLAAGRAAAKPACRVRQAPRAEARIRIRLFPCSPPTPPESFPLAGYSFVCCLIEPVRFLSRSPSENKRDVRRRSLPALLFSGFPSGQTIALPFPPLRVEREGKVQRFTPIAPCDSTLEQPADDLLDQSTPTQIANFRSHSVQATVAIDDEKPLSGQEAEDRVAEAIVVGGGLVRVEAKFWSKGFQDDLVNADHRLGGDKVAVGDRMQWILHDQV